VRTRRGGGGSVLLVATALAALLAARPVAAQVGSAPGAGEKPGRMLAIALSRPLMGENYDLVSGLLDVDARIPRWRGGGWIVHAGLAYSTAGRTRSALVENPAVGVWMHAAGVPLELLLSVPLGRELGSDDFATDMAYLSDLTYRERYLPGRWAASLAFAPHVTFRDGSVGDAHVGAVAVAPHGDLGTDVRARYGVGVGLGFSRTMQAGARFVGTLRLTGSGGLDDRTRQDLTGFLRLVRVRGRPELSFRLPLDIDLQDYVTGVVGLRLSF